MATAIPIPEKLALRIREAERLTGLPREHLYAEIRAGALPAIRTSDHGPWYVTRIDLDRWLAAIPRAAF